MSQVEVNSIMDLDGGIINKKFLAEWEKVLENINDPNLKADAVREITISIKIKPPATGTGPARTLTDVKSKLVKEPAEEGTLYLARNPKSLKLDAYSFNPDQLSLDLDSQEEPMAENVKPIKPQEAVNE